MWRQASELRRWRKKSEWTENQIMSMFIKTEVFNLLSKWQWDVPGINILSEDYHKKNVFHKVRSTCSSAATRYVPHSQRWSADSLVASLQLRAALRLCTLLTATPQHWRWNPWPFSLSLAKGKGNMSYSNQVPSWGNEKVEWANVAQNHCENCRTSSLSQLGSDNFIKIF